MPRRATIDPVENSGNDSFLDIVANLVGILVILIMVLGVRARNAWHTAAETTRAVATSAVPRPEPNIALQKQVAAKSTEVELLQQDAHRLDAKAKQLAYQAQVKQAQRNELQLLVAAAEAELAEKTDKLDQNQRARLVSHQAVVDAQAELSKLQSQLQALEVASETQPQVLHHHPTPLARTVFGREEHFRLDGRRLVYVPLNQIVDELRSDAEDKLWKLEGTNAITEVLGPFGGFRVKYTVHRRQRMVDTLQGTMLQKTIELQRFTLIPVAEELGVPIAQAMAEGSDMRKFLATLDPEDTTITVWTYPDSFEDYRQFKETLRQMGFTSAARPLPHGHPIGGSPDGSRSASE